MPAWRATSSRLWQARSAPMVAGCRVVRDGTDVRRWSWVERSRIMARWCADRLTALLTATLTAVLTDELAGRFLRFGIPHHAMEGLRAPAAHSNTHSSRSQPCEWGRARSETRLMIGMSARARIGKGYVGMILVLSGHDKGDCPSERSQQREIANALRHLTPCPTHSGTSLRVRRGPNRTSSTRRS